MFDEEKYTIRKFFRENRVGVYTTITIHLIVLIILLVSQISHIKKAEVAFVIDFSKQEKREMEIQKLERKESFEKELDRMLSPRNQELRNVAVDKSDLRDDRHNNPSEIYDEARRVQERLDAARREMEQQQEGEDIPGIISSEQEKSEPYKGPSVLSYDLGGRKAMRLPVPVYQCQGGGDVTVLIEVDRRGYVTSTVIRAQNSTNNNCLHEAAQRAARNSRFAVDSGAPERQKGHIVYRFIAQ